MPAAALTASPAIWVVIGDGRALVLAGLVSLLNEHPDLAVGGTAGTADGIVALVRRTKPDVVLLHAALPGGADTAASSIRRLKRPVGIVVFDHEARADSPTADLPRDHAIADQWCSFDELVALIEGVARGPAANGAPTANGALGQNGSTAAAAPGPGAVLTVSELRVLRSVAAGHTNREVGRLLGLSEHTVRAHLRSISRKLGVQNRLHIVSEARRRRLWSEAPIGR